jgi:hypothetical protein
VDSHLELGGGKPKPPKFPSGQIERRHNGIEVDELPAVTKGVRHGMLAAPPPYGGRESVVLAISAAWTPKRARTSCPSLAGG